MYTSAPIDVRVRLSLCVHSSIHKQATMQTLPLRILIKQIIVNYLHPITTPTWVIENQKKQNRLIQR